MNKKNTKLFLIITLLVLLSCSSPEIVKPDYCAERGHVLIAKHVPRKTREIVRIEDYGNQSLKITDTGRMILYECARCGEIIYKFKVVKSDTVIIWEIINE